MGMRRFTRLTKGFSKKVENLVNAISLHFMYYNFVRIHQNRQKTARKSVLALHFSTNFGGQLIREKANHIVNFRSS